MAKPKKPTAEEVRVLAEKLANDPELLGPKTKDYSERLAMALLTKRLHVNPATGLPNYKSPDWRD